MRETCPAPSQIQWRKISLPQPAERVEQIRNRKIEMNDKATSEVTVVIIQQLSILMRLKHLIKCREAILGIMKDVGKYLEKERKIIRSYIKKE